VVVGGCVLQRPGCWFGCWAPLAACWRLFAAAARRHRIWCGPHARDRDQGHLGVGRATHRQRRQRRAHGVCVCGWVGGWRPRMAAWLVRVSACARQGGRPRALCSPASALCCAMLHTWPPGGLLPPVAHHIRCTPAPLNTHTHTCTHAHTRTRTHTHTHTHTRARAQLLYVDTEGFESTGRSNSYDDRVFAVATVLSSLLVYNLPETVRGSDVSKLSFVVELAAGFYDRGNTVRVVWQSVQRGSVWWAVVARWMGHPPACACVVSQALLLHARTHARTRAPLHTCRRARAPALGCCCSQSEVAVPVEPGSMLWVIQRDFLQGAQRAACLFAWLARVAFVARLCAGCAAPLEHCARAADNRTVHGWLCLPCCHTLLAYTHTHKQASLCSSWCGTRSRPCPTRSRTRPSQRPTPSAPRWPASHATARATGVRCVCVGGGVRCALCCAAHDVLAVKGRGPAAWLA
jgi:hypothetical protein